MVTPSMQTLDHKFLAWFDVTIESFYQYHLDTYMTYVQLTKKFVNDVIKIRPGQEDAGNEFIDSRRKP